MTDPTKPRKGDPIVRQIVDKLYGSGEPEPMTPDELRDRITDALRLNENPPIWPRGWERQRDAVLREVRAAIAAELDAAADTCPPDAEPLRWVRDRAARWRAEPARFAAPCVLCDAVADGETAAELHAAMNAHAAWHAREPKR